MFQKVARNMQSLQNLNTDVDLKRNQLMLEIMITSNNLDSSKQQPPAGIVGRYDILHQCKRRSCTRKHFNMSCNHSIRFFFFFLLSAK